MVEFLIIINLLNLVYFYWKQSDERKATQLLIEWFIKIEKDCLSKKVKNDFIEFAK